MSITVLIALNKAYPVPDDPAYLPVYVGQYGRTLAREGVKPSYGAFVTSGFTGDVGNDSASKKIGCVPNPTAAGAPAASRPFAFDHTGDNISEKNPHYCELTALYWGWKNVDSDYLGLVHYRRHFRGRSWCPDLCAHVLSTAEMEQHFREADLILPAKRRYYIETIESHFRHTHEPEALDLTQEILRERYPDYSDAMRHVLKHRSAHMFNMMIARREVVDAYCTWLFDILGELEQRLDLTGYPDFEARVFGRISEMLLDVWVTHNRIVYTEVPFLIIDDTGRLRRMKRFLLAKYFNRKYKDQM